VIVARFERARPENPVPVCLDPSQQAVVELVDDACAAVLGAPGTGKTTTLLELVADRVLVRGWTTDQLIVLTPSRLTATRLRDAIALRLGVPTTGPMARTVNSLAFEIVRDAARVAGTPPPRLVTGGEQDADIAQLLAGAIEDGAIEDSAIEDAAVEDADRLRGTGPQWPAELGREVRGLRRFRTELRELMMRATEYDVPPARLRQLGLATGHPEWVAAADFIDEYLEVVSTSREVQFDPAELARFAVEAIGSGEPGERVASLRLVLIDDLQEATESTLALLRALAAQGIAVIAFGDPDVAANAFRGGEPDALGRLATVLARPDIPTLTLSTAHRQGPALRGFTAAVTARIGAAAAGTQRAAVAGGTDSAMPIARVEATSPAREWAAIARVLRQEHLEVPLEDERALLLAEQQPAERDHALHAVARERQGLAVVLGDDRRLLRGARVVARVREAREPLQEHLELEERLLAAVLGQLRDPLIARVRLLAAQAARVPQELRIGIGARAGRNRTRRQRP